jgi:hypothetical protein
MTPEVKTKRYFLCPNCGKEEMIIEHLFQGDGWRSFGPWRCQECDHEISGECHPNGTLRITKVQKAKNPPVLLLLRFRDQYMVICGYTKDEDGYDFLVHSHQCPTHLMRSVLQIYDPEQGRDPHGIFRFVAAIDDTDKTRKELDECTSLESIFWLFNTDGDDAPTIWPESNGGVIPGLAAIRKSYEPKA